MFNKYLLCKKMLNKFSSVFLQFWFEATWLLNLAAQKNYLDIFLIIQTLGSHPGSTDVPLRVS